MTWVQQGWESLRYAALRAVYAILGPATLDDEHDPVVRLRVEHSRRMGEIRRARQRDR